MDFCVSSVNGGWFHFKSLSHKFQMVYSLTWIQFYYSWPRKQFFNVTVRLRKAKNIDPFWIVHGNTHWNLYYSIDALTWFRWTINTYFFCGGYKSGEMKIKRIRLSIKFQGIVLVEATNNERHIAFVWSNIWHFNAMNAKSAIKMVLLLAHAFLIRHQAI